MIRRAPHFLTFATALLLAGCGGAKLAEAPAPSIVAAEPAKPAIAGVLAGSVGQKLDKSSRQKAFDAQMLALDSGQRRSWKGERGSFGYVEIGPETARSEGACRSYSHKIYVAGRPQSGEGLACRAPDGAWRMAG